MIDSNFNWTEPKTDWSVSYDGDGNYTGDYFEPEDYNRIKNNISYLYDLSQKLFATGADFTDLGEDVDYGSATEFFASWWKTLQDDLEAVNVEALGIDIGTRATYYANQAGALLNELLRVEQATALIYKQLMGVYEGKQRLAFRLGNFKGLRV